MGNIVKFIGNAKKNSILRNKELINIIQTFCRKKAFVKIINDISSTLGVSSNSLLHDSKIFLHKNYSPKNMQFNKKISLKYLPTSCCKFILFFIYIYIFSNNKKTKKKSTELVVDQIYDNLEAKRFYGLKKYFKNIIFITYNKLDGNFNRYYFLNYKNLNRNILFHKIPILIKKIFFKSIIFSIRNKINIFDLILFLISQTFKYNNIFSNINARYLIQERHYGTSAVKSFIFKKYGGKLVAVIQKNIAQLTGPGTFCYADIFFSLGNKTHEKAILSGGKFKKIIPVGSMFMESIYLNIIKKYKLKYDLVNIISNAPNVSDGYINYYKNWITHLEWLKKLSQENKKLKIIIKRRPFDNLGKNNFLEKFFKGSNVKIVIGTSKLNRHHSYEHSMQSKVACAWSSTMGYELIGHKKPCIFMDPNGENLSFIPSDKLHKSIKVLNYSQFKKKFYSIYNNKKNFFKNINKNNFCLNSKYVSKKIYEGFLKK